MTTTQRKDDLFATLPLPWPDVGLAAEIERAVTASGRKVVVLDDDPTGTQTVHDIDVLATWQIDDLAVALADPAPAFYILTNSRSLSAAQAALINQEIAHNLVQAARRAGREFVIVSRSDSTLRGHYPAEVDALANALEAELGRPYDGLLLIPFFLEGGRYTLDDVHYVLQGERLVPAGETEFARDPAFAYHSSDLRRWVEEKTAGRIPASTVASISLATLRQGGPAAVERLLRTVQGRTPVIVNAAAYADLEVLVAGLLAAEQAGKRFLYRTAASFVRVRSAIAPRGLLTAADLFAPGARRRPGLIVVGSHVARSTDQWRSLLTLPEIAPLQMDVPAILNGTTREEALQVLEDSVTVALGQGQDVVLATSRRVIVGGSPEDNLAIARAVSEALCALVRRVVRRTPPAFVVAKGGITSSDVATQALGIRRARVLGQVQPGVPVWRAGAESLLPGAPYVVFPGNVGTADTLRDIVAQCRG